MSSQSVITQNTSESTRTLLLGLWGHLSQRRRLQLGLLLVVMLVSGVAELVSLGAVLPFLAMLSNPESLWEQSLVQLFAAQFGITEASELLLPATLTFALSALISAFIRLSNLWLNGRLAAAVGSDLSCEAYRRTLYQPYEVHVHRNSAEVITSTTSQIARTVGAINSLLQLITSAVVAVCLLTGLLLIDAVVALAAALLFGGAYLLLGFFSRRELRRNGQKISEALSQQLKALQEGLGSIRDVLLDSNQLTYLQIYQQADRPQRQLQAKNVFLGIFPRYAFEALGMVSIALLGCLLVMQRGSGTSVISLLGVLALGSQRLLPALQQIYRSWASLKGYNAAIQSVLSTLNQSLPPLVKVQKPFSFSQSIRLEGVYFHYDKQQSEVLKGLDIEIRKGECIGIIGTTGSGKSTMIDVIMGLLSPTKGSLVVDGVDLHDPMSPERILSWRSSIAHVPQSIYLSDSSIAENIAFGVRPEEIDMDRVKQAARQAQIESFIESSANGYATFVGERGIRLSGGQRQRIGIARALYKQASVLVLDEATSALDTVTEQVLINSIDRLSQDLTVLMIAHRLTTVERCDRVIRLVNGVVEIEGPPHQVLNVSS